MDLAFVEDCKSSLDAVGSAVEPYIFESIDAQNFGEDGYVIRNNWGELERVGAGSMVYNGLKLGWKDSISQLYGKVVSPWSTDRTTDKFPAFGVYSLIGSGQTDREKEFSLHLSIEPSIGDLRAVMPERAYTILDEIYHLKDELNEEKLRLSEVAIDLMAEKPKVGLFRRSEEKMSRVRAYDELVKSIGDNRTGDYIRYYVFNKTELLKKIPGEKLSGLQEDMKKLEEERAGLKGKEKVVSLVDGLKIDARLQTNFLVHIVNNADRRFHERFYSRNEYKLSQEQIEQGYELKPWSRRTIIWGDLKEGEKAEVLKNLEILAGQIKK